VGQIEFKNESRGSASHRRRQLPQLPNLIPTKQLSQLQKLEQLQQLPKLSQLRKLQQLPQLPQLQQLPHSQQLPHIQQLPQLRQLPHSQQPPHMQQLPQLQQLAHSQQLPQLQPLHQLSQALQQKEDHFNGQKSVGQLSWISRQLDQMQQLPQLLQPQLLQPQLQLFQPQLHLLPETVKISLLSKRKVIDAYFSSISICSYFIVLFSEEASLK
jgi:hypothetical protein